MYDVQFNDIEKIKIIGSTFMAACGLISGRKNSFDFNGESEPFSKERLNIHHIREDIFFIIFFHLMFISNVQYLNKL